MAYLTLAELKQYLDVNTSADDPVLVRCLDAATAFIESPAGAGRVFSAAPETRTFTRAGHVEGMRLYLDDDLARIDSITVNGTALVAADYTVQPRRAVPYYAIDSNGITWIDDIEITGVYAYSVTPPADIVQACTRLAAYYYRQRETGSEAESTQVTLDGVRIFPASVPKDVLTICQGYRRYV